MTSSPSLATQKKILYGFLLTVIVGEIITTYYDFGDGIILHMSLIVALFCLEFYWHLKRLKLTDQALLTEDTRINQIQRKKILEQVSTTIRFEKLLIALMLAPMIRILSLVMPLYHFRLLYWFMIISIPIFITYGIYMWRLKLPFHEYGVRLPEKKYLWLEVLIVAVAPLFGLAEYWMLRPTLIVQNIDAASIITAVLIILIGTGIMEELVFRGLLQNLSIDILGVKRGVFFIAGLFAALHIGNVIITNPLSVLDLALAGSVGALYGFVFFKTKSIIGISLSHMVINSFLFIVGPLMF